MLFQWQFHIAFFLKGSIHFNKKNVRNKFINVNVFNLNVVRSSIYVNVFNLNVVRSSVYIYIYIYI